MTDYTELIAKARRQAKDRQGGFVNPLCDAVERLSDIVEELQKHLDAQVKRAERAEAQRKCHLCGRSFDDGALHINCADTGVDSSRGHYVK